MDFVDIVRKFSERAASIKESITTEEATKTSLIMPFFQQVLGYDVFDNTEFCPEYTADVGIKKGEKVDFAIMKDGEPMILIEAKWCGENLDRHSSQLFRYFGTTKAKFGILTNGITYNFYTDLDEANKMDLKPFLEINLFNLKEPYIAELKKFHKTVFNVEEIFSTASELKYSNEIKTFFAAELKAPSVDFVKFILGKIYEGRSTQNVIEKFTPIIKSSLNSYINELMNEKITSALKNDGKEDDESATDTPQEVQEPQEPKAKIVTTAEEIEAYYAVKYMLREIVPSDKIAYKDTSNYFGILYENNTRKWICRFKLEGSKKYLILPDENKNELRYEIASTEDIFTHHDELIEVINRYI